MRTVVIFFLTLLTAGAFAQAIPQPAGTAQKLGYANWEYIFGQLPEYKTIETALKTHSAQLEATVDGKRKEFETKYQAYQAGAGTMLDAVRKDKEAELQQLQASIQKFQTDAQASFQKKQNDLMEPVFTKVGNTIETVAVENGYTYIINPVLIEGGDILLYHDEKYDISGLVLKKLGVTPVAAAVQK